MSERGYERAFAERCLHQIEGFADYGFPMSHAASFAQLVYVSAWMKWHYPDVFCAAMLNSQPMGFYAPAQLVRDAALHGVEIRSPDVNASEWDYTLESPPRCGKVDLPKHSEGKSGGGPISTSAPHPARSRLPTSQQGGGKSKCAVRLGFRQIKGFQK